MAVKQSRWLLISSVSVLAATAAAAQSSPNLPAPVGSADKGLQDIVVTAQRRAERLQDVPVAVTAFGTAELQRRQIVDIQALTTNAPAITFTATPYGSNDLILAIRGVAPGGVLPNVDQAVGTYVDGLYYARPEGSNFALVDMASAEVLRGPQGTLFGRNTIAGALNITTNKPSYDFGGSVKVGYGNYDAVTATGILNLPIVDGKLAARIVYSHASHSGYGHNIILNKDVADQDDNFVRASLRGDLSERFRADVSFDYYHGVNHEAEYVLAFYQPGLSPVSVAPYLAPSGSRISQTGIDPLNRSKTYDATGTFTYDLGFATLKSITAFRHIDYNGAGDQDGTPLPTVDALKELFKGHQVSQEFQINGKTDDNRLTWVAGLYYFDEEVRNTAVVRAGSAIQVNELVPNNESMSAFAQLTYEVLPKLRLTGGVRYVIDHRNIFYYHPIYPVAASSATDPNPPAGAIGAATCPYTAIGLNQDPNGCSFRPRQITFKTVPFTVGIDYKPSNNDLIYAKISKGYRSGGFQQPTGTTVAFFTPFTDESVMSYEGGAKLSFLNNHLRLSMAGYYSTYNRVQQNSLLTSTPAVVIAVVNAGRERIYGGEFEATALIQKLRLNASLGLTEPKFTSGPYVGTPVPTVAKTTWGFSGDYPIEIEAAGTLDLHVDYNHRSKVNFLNIGSVGASGALVPYSAFQAAAVSQGGYGLLAAQVSFTFKKVPVTLTAFGKNLANAYYAGRSGSLAAANYNSIVLGDPRTYGVSLSYKF